MSPEMLAQRICLLNTKTSEIEIPERGEVLWDQVLLSS